MGQQRRLRVLLLAESPYFGGITNHILTLARALGARDDVDVGVATFPGRRPDAALIERGKDFGIPVHVIPMAFAYDLRMFGRLKGYVHDECFDLVHTHNYRATLAASRAGLRVPVITTCHGTGGESSVNLETWKTLELRSMRRQSVVIAVSEHVRGWLALRNVSKDRIRIVHNGCDAPDEMGVALSREILGIPPNALLTLFAGRLAPGKGADAYIEALAGADGVFGLVVGDGPLRVQLEQHAEAIHAPVTFIGQVPEVGPYYALADVVVLPSQMEAFPMVLLEAAACGKPVVATRVGGIPEIVEEGVTGILVEPGDAHALTQAMLSYCDANTRRTAGEKARARWKARFTPEHMADATVAAYREVVAIARG